MIKLNKDDIEILSRHSNWSEKSIDKALKEHIYSTKATWQKFLKLFCISLGVGFTVAGIIFFFAYNWADLHKFVKIGLIEALLVALTLVVVFSKLNSTIKNTLLTGTAMLVGVLFAVFGQIYQTGANAYDFFLGWTLFIILWVVVSNFAPLWLIFITLINTTIILYSEQVAHSWSFVFLTTLLFAINGVFLIAALLITKFTTELKPPHWFTNTLTLGTVTASTVGLCYGIFDAPNTVFFILLLITLVAYGAGIRYGLKLKNAFYLAIIPFSAIVISTALFINISDNEGMFLFITLFVIASVTAVIKTLINLQKKWTN